MIQMYSILHSGLAMVAVQLDKMCKIFCHDTDNITALKQYIVIQASMLRKCQYVTMSNS